MALTPTAPVTRRTTASADAVWRILSDGWLYASWVVGASRVRDVDDNWPDVGARLHHSFGPWPLVVNDSTEVLRSEPGRLLVLQARGWPIGEATVELTISGEPDGGCELQIAEDASAGPGQLIPKPVRQAIIIPRNRETLLRLALLAERRES